MTAAVTGLSTWAEGITWGKRIISTIATWMRPKLDWRLDGLGASELAIKGRGGGGAFASAGHRYRARSCGSCRLRPRGKAPMWGRKCGSKRRNVTYMWQTWNTIRLLEAISNPACTPPAGARIVNTLFYLQFPLPFRLSLSLFLY